MTTNNLLASINSQIEGIAKVSSGFKSDLASVVRNLLIYVPESGDIGALNRLLSVLNKTDKAMVIAFFRNFLPWKWDGVANGGMFTTKSKNGPRVTAMYANITTWLKDEANNIWDWQKQTNPRPELNVAQEKERITSRITTTIARAIAPKAADGKSPNKTRLPAKLVVQSIISAGISLDEIIEVVLEAKAVRDAEQAKADALVKQITTTANENMPKPKATRKAAAGK